MFEMQVPKCEMKCYSRYVGCHWLIKPATLIGRNASLWLRSHHKCFVAYAVCARTKIFCLPFHWFVRAIINIVCDCYNEWLRSALYCIMTICACDNRLDDYPHLNKKNPSDSYVNSVA